MAAPVRRAGPDDAADAAWCTAVASIVNAAYALGEAGMWRPGAARIEPEGIAGLVAARELLVAGPADAPVGCVRVHRLDETTWGFGMLAVDPAQQGAGAGGALVDAAEAVASAAGARTMQLEILVPVRVRQDSKVRLQSWYGARGYARLRRDALEDHHPDLVPLVAVACTYDVWQKPLRPH